MCWLDGPVTRLRRLWPLVVILIGAIGLKGLLLALDAVPFNADEAVVALMARHILQGERPWFFYGQAYMGSLDAYLVAGAFRVLGERVLAIRLVQLTLFVATLLTSYSVVLRLTGGRHTATLVALLVASAWRALGRRRFVLPLASAILSGAMLANGVAVLKEVYREVALGLDAELRDERGRIAPPPRRRWVPRPGADGADRPGPRGRIGLQGRGESW